VAVFGAGHVAAALAHCLSQLDCRLSCIDPRQEWLDKIPEHTLLTKTCVPEPRTVVADLRNDTFVICMTMGHGTDRPILAEIFKQQREFPFLGVIGSKAKRSVLKRELLEAGVTAEQFETIRCPLGLPLGTNQPGEIAVSIAAQLIQERDAWRAAAK